MAEGWFYLSQTLRRRGQLASAKKALATALSLDSTIEERLRELP